LAYLLFLKNISVFQFKNYQESFFQFDERVVGICGNNGVGKTNLLDAIYYLCFTKSYFTNTDQQNIRKSHSGFRIHAHLDLDNQNQEISCILRETGRKEFLLNGEEYEKFSLHIGKFPCVIIAPDDTRTITEGSEERRRYMDALLSQLDPSYLQALLLYNRILQQRNRFLRTYAPRKSIDTNLLDVYDEQLIKPGNQIFEKRRQLLQGILPLVQAFNLQIAGKDVGIYLKYSSSLLDCSFEVLLNEFRDKDLFLQRTNIGIHRDDIEIKLEDQTFKNIASQGQRKSILFAMKLAEYETLRVRKGFAPLLLLDDVFEKLDQERMNNLLGWVGLQDQAQIFITDTHSSRIKQHLDQVTVNHQLIEL
jgi:DNA replication and repair protein RecF